MNLEPQPQTTSGDRARDLRELAERLAPRIVEMRYRRRTIDEDDLNAYAMWIGKRTRFMYESDQFKHYIPAGRRAVERNVIRATQMLYPSSDFFEVYPGDEVSLAAGVQADAVRAFMLHLTETKLKMRRNVTQLLRCLLLYKRCILKNDIRVIDMPNVSFGGFKGSIQQVWPGARVVDPFMFYVWPETATDPEEAEIFCEDVMMPWSVYQRNVERKVCDPIRADQLAKPEWPYHLIQRMGYSGLTDPTADASAYAATIGVPTRSSAGPGILGPDGRPAKSQPKHPDIEFVALSEIWFRMRGYWYQAWLVWNVQAGPSIVRFQASPYPFPPYRMGLARPIPNQHYTNGLAQDIEPLNVWFNDTVNQSEEARVISGLPPTLVNPDLVARMDSLVWGPRRKWFVQDLDRAIKVLEVPDNSPTSQRAMQFIYGLINSLGGSSSISEGQPMRNMPRAGVAVNNLITLGMADIEDSAKIVEQEVLTPSLGDWFQLALAFTPPAQILAIPGTHGFPPRTMTINDLFGNWQFRWVGSLQAQNQQAKGMQLLNFAKILFQAVQPLAQQGWAVNFGLLGKRVWRDSLGERGVEQIIIPMADLAKVNPAGAAMMQQQMLAGGTPGPVPGPGLPIPAPGDQAGVDRSIARAQTETAMGQLAAGNQ